jgi:hypothetical protein
MSARMLYRLTPVEICRIYRHKIVNLSFLVWLNVAAIILSLVAQGVHEPATAPGVITPDIALIIDLSLIYVFLDDIGTGTFAGLAAGLSFGAAIVPVVIALETRSTLAFESFVWVALAVPSIAFVVAVFRYRKAVRHVLHELRANRLPNQPGALTARRRRECFR